MGIFARPIASAFNNESQVVETAVLYLRVVPLSYSLQGILQIGSTILNVFKKPFHATGLMILQIFIIYVPFAIIGSRLFGLIGIFSSLAISYIISGIVAHFELLRQINLLNNSKITQTVPGT